MSKIILDLCGGTGSWSRPWKEAGYDVRVITLPDYDVREFSYAGDPVFGILAAPPLYRIQHSELQSGKPQARLSRPVSRIHGKDPYCGQSASMV